MLSVGIVGLPNVGKSTLFNLLTAGGAAVSNYPFTTIDSNVGVAAVPDPRLRELERILEPEECTPCGIEFIDIAGLVEGASRGEGLGNQFLGHIRKVDALAHVLRCFAGTDVSHVFAEVDPVRDAEIVETELLLADLELMEKTLEKRRRAAKADPRAHREELERLELYRGRLEAGEPLSGLGLDREQERELKALGLLTGKPVIYVANVSEESYRASSDPEAEDLARRLAARPGPAGERPVVAVSARIELELQELEPAERAEFVAGLGLESSGLDRLIETAFDALGLIRFYTVANRKLRAWEVEADTLAPQAAGKIHSDMEAGFVRASVASYEELRDAGSFAALHHQGKLRTEGKGYAVRDGDVIEFLFSG